MNNFVTFMYANWYKIKCRWQEHVLVIMIIPNVIGAITWISIPNKVIYKWLVIGADCHNVEGNQGEVGANLHSTAQINIRLG